MAQKQPQRGQRPACHRLARSVICAIGYNRAPHLMTPERWQRVKDLCQRALEREPRDRGAFLAGICLDDHELRRDVETLLMQATEGEGILDAPVWQKLGIAAPTMARARAPAARRCPKPSGVIACCAWSAKEAWGPSTKRNRTIPAASSR